MAPPRPPELMGDVISEILLRLPPSDPASLVRASLVCKPWRRLLTDGAFLDHYHAFHRSPPVLGFFQNQDDYHKGSSDLKYVPTIHASPIPQPAVAVAGSHTTISCNIIDCRHGRVLFLADNQLSETLIVWDPITGDQKRIPPPKLEYDEFTAAVLCAADGCDHLQCNGGPFLVVVVGINYVEEEEDDDDDDADVDGGLVAWASLYSSETGVWSASSSVAVDVESYTDIVMPSLLARDTIYFTLKYNKRHLKYSLVSRVLSVIDAPPQHKPNMIFAAAQDGKLGAATVEGYNLHLWSWRATDPNSGIGEWAKFRVIELDVMIPISIGNPSTRFDLAGFAEGTGTLFIFANDDIFTVELKSGKITKMGKRTSDNHIFPFTSFYTPDLVTARLQVPMRTG